MKIDLNLTPDGKEELALALLLWKDFKSQDGLNVHATITALEMADRLGVKAEFEELNLKLPPLRITPK